MKKVYEKTAADMVDASSEFGHGGKKFTGFSGLVGKLIGRLNETGKLRRKK